jgi:hypothetical protein
MPSSICVSKHHKEAYGINVGRRLQKDTKSAGTTPVELTFMKKRMPRSMAAWASGKLAKLSLPSRYSIGLGLARPRFQRACQCAKRPRDDVTGQRVRQPEAPPTPSRRRPPGRRPRRAHTPLSEARPPTCRESGPRPGPAGPRVVRLYSGGW